MNKRTVSDYIREKKKLILIILLVLLLAVTVYLFFGDTEEQSAVTQTETEAKIAAVLSVMDGVGDVEVVITEAEGAVTGVVVVCEGADSILVRNNILNAVSTALNINKNLIAIYSM
ncbi:MAG: hypothetical protein LUI60_00790 [Clostridia bacterium]|nr:hypothetical protein [Clostridia bacterium]